MVLSEGKLEATIRILEIYNGFVESLRKKGGGLVNGCERRAEEIRRQFIELRLNPVILVARSVLYPWIHHESGSSFYHHHTILVDGLVFDPNYTGRRPLPLSIYTQTAYPNQDDIALFQKQNNGYSHFLMPY